jgi:uncharacterized protein (DUF885 family)
VAPFKTLADYENNLKRHQQYAAAVDKIIGRFREGHGLCVVHPSSSSATSLTSSIFS